METEHYRFVKGVIRQHVTSHWGLQQVMHVLRERLPEVPLKNVFIKQVFSNYNDYDVWLISDREIKQEEFFGVYEYFVTHQIDCFRQW